MKPDDKIFTVEHQFQLYLQRAGIMWAVISENQRIETKRAFYGAWGQCLLNLRDEASTFPEEVGVGILEKQLQEILAFWNKESNRQN